MGKTKKAPKPPGDDNCSICKAICSDDEEATECDCCKKWVHRKCSDISLKAYKNYSDDKMACFGFFWLCVSCRTKFTDWAKQDSPGSNTQIEKLSQQISEINIQLKNIEATHNNIQKTNTSINELASTFSKTSSEKSWAEVAAGSNDQNAGLKLISNLTKQVLNGQKKLSDERNDREKNALIFNVNEKNSDQNADQKFFNDFCLKTLDLKDIPDSKINRIGRAKDGYNRPIKVSFSNSFDKRTFFLSLYKMKMDKTLDEKIRVAHDMCNEDREENKRLLKYAYEKNNNENPKDFRYKVRGPPWDMKVVKVFAKN